MPECVAFSYFSTLEEATLRTIGHVLPRTTHFILLLRDPVERLASLWCAPRALARPRTRARLNSAARTRFVAKVHAELLQGASRAPLPALPPD